MVLIWVISLNAQPQNFNSGMLFEDEIYETLPREKSSEGSKAILPPKVDLKPFCPPVRNQGELYSCVGWAAGYGALTIQRAIQNNCRDKRTIEHNASSALFIYNQINNGNCSRGSRISEALDFMKESGDCLAREFDFDVNDCEKQPNEDLQKTAQNNTIEDYLTLFGHNDHPRFKVHQVKYALARKKPVIIGLAVRRNFYQLQNATYWWPENGNISPAGGHALTVIGYDDKKGAFQLFNSWGDGWGDYGFIWIKYADFGRFCKYAYVLYLDGQDKNSYHTKPQNLSSNTPTKPIQKLGGNLDFRFVARRSQQTGAPIFQNAKIRFQNTHYELIRKNWKVGQLFQILVNQTESQGYVYVFSIDQSGNSKMHWPRKMNLENPTHSDNSFLIPSQNKALKISQTGKEYLIALFSTQKIENLSQLIQILRNQTDNLPQALWNTLGDKAISKTDIEFEPYKIGFKAQTRGKGFIVPIILEVECNESFEKKIEKN